MNEIIETSAKLVATTGVTEVIKILVNTHFKSRLEKFINKNERKYEYKEIEKLITKYITRTYNKNLYMSTIIFKNSRKTIEDLYIPLTVSKHNIKGNSREELLIDKYKDEFISKYKKVLLVDNAGMGKSTIMKYLFQRAIIEKKGVPILIELRKLDKETKIIDYICNEVNDNKEYFTKKEIYLLLEEGDFIFFFDGYDEIIPESKGKVTEDLQDFIGKNSNSKFIISSREEDELLCFGDFQRFDIKPLEIEEAYNLIKKYDNNEEMSSELIDKLENEDNMSLLIEFLENPLMVSLLYKAYIYKRTIPIKKAEFYTQVYNALYEEHDLSKGSAYKHNKASNLGRDDFHRVLRSISFISFKKGVIYSKDELINIVDKAKKKNDDLNFNTSDFIKDLVYSVPLFVREGIEFRWVHKSFQEYFFAEYIYTDAKENQKSILKKIIQDDNIFKYYNILDIYCDIDYKGFKTIVIYPLLNEFCNYCEDNYTQEYYNDFDTEIITERKALEFNYKTVTIKKLSNAEYVEYKLKAKSKDGFEYVFPKYMEEGYSVMVSSRKVGMIYKKKWYYYIIKILESRDSTIFDDIKMSRIMYNNMSSIIEEIPSFVEEVDDSVSKVINSKENFDAINKLLFNNLFSKNLRILNYNECKKLKAKIEREIESEENDLDFI